MNKLPYDKRHLKFGNSSAILDPYTMAVLKQFKPELETILYDVDIVDTFTSKYLSWIKSTTLNCFIGFENYSHKCYSNGTTEAFDKFYAKNSLCRFRCFKGEYMYHQLSWRNNYKWKFIEDEKLIEGDAVVISLPFSDTGNKHQKMNEVLESCSSLNIPVLIDCAYFGICESIDFDLSQPCITDVVFSLSKTFPVSHARIGMRLTKTDNDDPLFVVNKSDYVNRLGAAIGLEFINRFTSDYVPLTYKSKQLEFCNYLSVIPSNTVLFGIGDESWNEYNRGNTTNRLSFHKYYHLLPESFYNDCKSN